MNLSKKAIIISLVLCLVVISGLLLCKPKLASEEAEFFSYLFDAVNDDVMSLDEIMEQDDEDKLSDLFIYISDKSYDGEKFNDCTVIEQNFWILYKFHFETECGGIEQFIYNYDDYELALDIFNDLNLTASKAYLQAAMALYPDKKIEIYTDEELSKQLEAVDEQYYHAHEDEYYSFIDDYVKQNKNQFK